MMRNIFAALGAPAVLLVGGLPGAGPLPAADGTISPGGVAA